MSDERDLITRLEQIDAEVAPIYANAVMRWAAAVLSKASPSTEASLIPAAKPVGVEGLTEAQRAKLNDFKGCLDEHEGMRCASTAMRVREAALDFALSVVLSSSALSAGTATPGGEK